MPPPPPIPPMMPPAAGSSLVRKSTSELAAAASEIVPINARKNKRALTEPIKQRTKQSVVSVPPPKPVADDKGRIPMLSSYPSCDLDESYSEEERLLCNFQKLHPMLSLETTSHRVMQFVSDSMKDFSIPTKELEVVSKSHDDQFLAPANTLLGERHCVLGDRCTALWLAKWRYGEDTPYAFLCKEFLLPSELKTFQTSGKLPEVQKKCLLCTRYYATFLYRVARTDPSFNPSSQIQVQSFCNSMGSGKGEDVPEYANKFCTHDGYSRDAMLCVDDSWCETAAARSIMGTMLFRPQVKFLSSNYVYDKDPDTGLSRIVQVFNGSQTPHFQQPAASSRTQQQQPVTGSLRTLSAAKTSNHSSNQS
jgi:hypothetical protein